MNFLNHYARKDVQKAILAVSKDREVGIKFGEKGYGKRPDILQYEEDVYQLAKQGATSFHISEERWQDPLLLTTSMSKKDLDKLRIAWDLMIDIDGKSFEYSKKAAHLVCEALKFHDIKNFSVKFSGNRGFHIGIRYESFPDVLNNIPTKELFPDGPKTIALFLEEFIRDELSNALLENKTITQLEKESRVPKLKENGIFNPFKLVELDTILISPRHLFRAPYSINEKSSLVSIPIKPNEILSFNPASAKIDNVKVNMSYLELYTVNESQHLIMQAFDWSQKTKKEIPEEIKNKKPNYDEFKITTKLGDQTFPPCIKLILAGLKDGKKRAVFILFNFLKSIGYQHEDIEKIILAWNKTNPEPLRDNYIQAQLSWHKRNTQNILPPNCSNPNYYTGIGVCKPDMLCPKIKNPVSYSIRKSMFNQNQGRKKRTYKKNED